MALIARYLIDTSAAARMTHASVAARLAPLIDAGLVATTAQLDAEALYSARNRQEYEQLWSDRRLAYEYLATDDEHWRYALDAQHELSRTGRHRAVGMADLLIAVIAASSGVTVIHYDHDFDIASEVIEFRHRWVATPGYLR
ncbi:PIN domain-containing protein [Gordonia sp. VNQ95]|uniref:PIN domain-containing protein n=1 Tax=Gordonia TaxID=2053 RepID=UPI0032B4DA14